jgi:hypothetical protein
MTPPNDVIQQLITALLEAKPAAKDNLITGLISVDVHWWVQNLRLYWWLTVWPLGVRRRPVRDARSGKSSGRLDRVLTGSFDLIR